MTQLNFEQLTSILNIAVPLSVFTLAFIITIISNEEED